MAGLRDLYFLDLRLIINIGLLEMIDISRCSSHAFAEKRSSPAEQFCSILISFWLWLIYNFEHYYELQININII